MDQINREVDSMDPSQFIKPAANQPDRDRPAPQAANPQANAFIQQTLQQVVAAPPPQMSLED